MMSVSFWGRQLNTFFVIFQKDGGISGFHNLRDHWQASADASLADASLADATAAALGAEGAPRGSR